MTLKNKSKLYKNSEMNNSHPQQHQEGGGVFKLTGKLSTDNKNLVESYRSGEPEKRQQLINTINTVLKNNGITDQVNTTESKISKRVSHFITRKVERDCSSQDATRRNLADKLQREFLAYLKNLGPDGTPMLGLEKTQGGPMQQQQPAMRMPSDTNLPTRTTFTRMAQAANQRYEEARQKVIRTKLLAQEAEEQLAQIERERAQKEKQESKIEHLHESFETAHNDLQPILVELSGGNMSQELINHLKQFAKMILSMVGELDDTTAKAANVQRSAINDLAKTAKNAVRMAEAGADTETIKTTLETVDEQLESNTEEIKNAETELQAQLEQLKQKEKELEQQNAELETAAQKAKEEKENAEAAAKEANEKAKTAETQAATNRIAREASNARAAELNKELAELKQKQEDNLKELNRILGEEKKSELSQPVLDAQNSARQTMGEITRNTEKLEELQQNPTENAKAINTLGERETQLGTQLQNNLENVEKALQASVASGNTQANNEAAQLAANIKKHKENFQNTLEQIKTTRVAINEVANQEGNKTPAGANKYVVAVNVGATKLEKNTNSNMRSFNLVNPASEQEEPSQSQAIPTITITEASNKSQEAQNESARPVIALDTHIEGETQPAQEANTRKEEEKTPSVTNNKAKNITNMRVALVLPITTEKSNNTSALASTAETIQSTEPKEENKESNVSTTPADNMNVALVKPKNDTEFEKAKMIPLPQSEEQEEQEGHEEQESTNEPRQEVILALAPNEQKKTEEAEDKSEENQYLEIFPAVKGNEPLPIEKAPGSSEYFEVGTAEKPATGGRKMTWPAVKRYFTHKKHHTKSKKSRLTLKVQSKKH